MWDLCDDLCHIGVLRNAEAGSRVPIVGPAEGGLRDIADGNGGGGAFIGLRQSGKRNVWAEPNARDSALYADLSAAAAAESIHSDANLNHAQFLTIQKLSRKSASSGSHEPIVGGRSRVRNKSQTIIVDMKKSSRVRIFIIIVSSNT